jgi:iron complex transport system ATP-binding protein
MVIPMEGRELRFSYEGLSKPALEGVSLKLEPGEFLAVLGPNGAGKSTLLKLLGGVLRSDSGSVMLEGQEIRRWSARERAQRLALVPQSLHSLPEVTVESFVGYGRYAYRRLFSGRSHDDNTAIRDALERADLSDLAQRPMAELSGGQRQRALVARALAQEARVLLVDEPTNALDPEHQLRVFDLLAELCERGHSVMVVTHELNLASQFVQSGLLLMGGKPVAAGPIDSILRPEVLEPVYGKELVFGEQWAERAKCMRPYVLPWKAGSRD